MAKTPTPGLLVSGAGLPPWIWDRVRDRPSDPRRRASFVGETISLADSHVAP